MTDGMRWKPLLMMYRRHAALKFEDGEFRKALELLDTDGYYDMPFDLLGGKTIMVPAEAVKPLRDEGLKFIEQPVVSASEATPEEIAQMRRECLP